MKGRSLPRGQPQSSIPARVFFPPSSGLTPGSAGEQRDRGPGGPGAFRPPLPLPPCPAASGFRRLLTEAGRGVRREGERYFYLVRAIIVPSSYRMPSLPSLIPVLAPPLPLVGIRCGFFRQSAFYPPGLPTGEAYYC